MNESGRRRWDISKEAAWAKVRIWPLCLSLFMCSVICPKWRYNPSTDPVCPDHFSPCSMNRKQKCVVLKHWWLVFMSVFLRSHREQMRIFHTELGQFWNDSTGDFLLTTLSSFPKQEGVGLVCESELRMFTCSNECWECDDKWIVWGWLSPFVYVQARLACSWTGAS